MIAVLEPSELRSDLTPGRDGRARVLRLAAGRRWGVWLIVVAAVAAFASTGNAGILSASRYPLAMARDRLVTPRLGTLGRFGTPVSAIVVTAALMIFVILALDVEGIAKLASAFQLFLFGLLNVAVIVMRESRIASYVPGYRSPWYPWIQIVGVITPVILVCHNSARALGLLAIGGGGLACARRSAASLWYRLLRAAQPGRRARGRDLPPVRAPGHAPLRRASTASSARS